jgi:GNAT superfamily N-acetyltransferase
MSIVASDQYRVRENWLYFPALHLNPAQIPFGLGVGRESTLEEMFDDRTARRQRLKVQSNGRDVTVLEVEASGSWRPVLPAFSRTVAGVKKGAPTVRIETAVADWQRGVARALVARSHYLSPRPGGLILLARIGDGQFAKQAREKWWSELETPERTRLGGDLERATGGLGDVVGALHLERLMHGHPSGRNAIYASVKRKPPTTPRVGSDPGFRRRVVRELGLYWISRVAVDVPFQGYGIGSALCDAAREVAATRMLEPGKHVELIRRLSIARFRKLEGGKSDFLTGDSAIFGVDLPFQLYTPYLSRKPGQIWNGAEGTWELVPRSTNRENPSGDCLAYYHAKAGPMVIKSKVFSKGRERDQG